MINNFMCDKCTHLMVCEKLKILMKLHEDAKKDLGITLTMDDCMDYCGHDEDTTEEKAH